MLHLSRNIVGQATRSSLAVARQARRRRLSSAQPADKNKGLLDYLPSPGVAAGFTLLFTFGGYLYRGSCERGEREDIVDVIKGRKPLAPSEIIEMRKANAVNVDAIARIAGEARRAFPSGRATVPEFVALVLGSNNDAVLQASFPPNLQGRRGIARGYHLERLLLSLQLEAQAQAQARSSDGDGGGGGDEVKLDVDTLVMAFSLLVKEKATKRVEALFHAFADTTTTRVKQGQGSGRVEAEAAMSIPALTGVVAALVETYQIPDEFLVTAFPGWTSWFEKPTHWRKTFAESTPRELLQRGLAASGKTALITEGRVERLQQTLAATSSEEGLVYHGSGSGSSTEFADDDSRRMENDDDGSTSLTLQEFSDLLLSRPICVWGHCYSSAYKQRMADRGKKKKKEKEGE